MRRRTPFTLAMACRAAADCSCGYTVNKTVEPDYAQFTDLLETDFLHTYDLSAETATNIGWIPQTYNQSITGASGPYGLAKTAANVVANPLASIYEWGGESINGGDPGVQLWVRSEVIDADGEQLVPTAEIVSARDDILYGSFRIGMKTTSTNGTCSAFFFYRNDTQEIDVEILSAQQHYAITRWPVNLVVQNTTAPLALDGSRPDTSNYEYHMAEPPDGDVGAQYREYRFDWLPDRIDYYVDSWHAITFRENIPSTPGAIHFSHWSNGNPLWSRGPPAEDAVMTVAYVKAYFNTTGSGTRYSGHDCDSRQWRSGDTAYCEIPDQYSSPWPGGPWGNITGRTFFFTRQNLDFHDDDTHPDDLERTPVDLVHTPDEASAVTIRMSKKKALWTLGAVIGVPSIATILYRML